MIFYFSGTGNSLWVAQELSKSLAEPLVSIADELLKTAEPLAYSIRPDETITFVFPVHSWGPALLVRQFIKQLQLTNYTNQPVYVVCTCGDEACYTDKLMSRLLKQKALKLSKAYTISMPNNYILLPGFDTDSKEVEQQKLQAALPRLQLIVDDMAAPQNARLYKTGPFPFFKSYIIYPLFRKYFIQSKPFYANDNCTSCGQCVKMCPTRTISLVEGKPKWNNACVQCLACINCCPVCAIEYGKISRKKGRYHHPIRGITS